MLLPQDVKLGDYDHKGLWFLTKDTAVRCTFVPTYYNDPETHRRVYMANGAIQIEGRPIKYPSIAHARAGVARMINEMQV